MKYKLTAEMEKYLETNYPKMPLVVQYINDVLGLSLQDLRDRSRIDPLIVGRCVFSYVCKDIPASIVGTYIDRSHNIVIKNKQKMESILDSQLKDGLDAYRQAYEAVINKLQDVEEVD